MAKKFLALAALGLIATTSLANAAPGTDAEHGRAAQARVLRPRVPAKPIAYGYVYTDGSVQSGTGNFTAVWDSGAQWYAIAITGINYYYSSYSTNVTSSIPTGATCQTDSVSGQLLVRCYNASGAPVQAAFGFTTF